MQRPPRSSAKAEVLAADGREVAKWWRALLRNSTWASVMLCLQRDLQDRLGADVVSLWAQLPPTGHWLRVMGKSRGELVLPPGSPPLGDLARARRPERILLRSMSSPHRQAFERAGLGDGWFVPLLAPPPNADDESWVGAVGLGWHGEAPSEPPDLARIAPPLWYLLRQEVENAYIDAVLEALVALGPPITSDDWHARIVGLRNWMGGDHWALYSVSAQDSGPAALSLITEHGHFAGRGMRLVRFMRENQEAFAQSALRRAMLQRRNVYVEDTYSQGFRITDDYGGEPVRSGFVMPLGDDSTGHVGLVGVYWGQVHGWRSFGLSARPWDALRRVSAEWWAGMQTSEAAVSDPLTGLLNRRGVAEHWALTVRRGEAGMLAVIDLDHFGEVNNRWGHLVGDGVLRALGTILSLVAQDHGGWCGRWGGDEFVLCLDARSKWPQVGAEIQQALDRAGQGAGWPQRVTMSGGAQRWIAGRGDWSETFDAADRALYRAKQRGRARFVLASRAPGDRHTGAVS